MASRSTDDTLDALDAIAGLLNTGLDRQSLASCVALIEGGVQPEALAAAILELRAEERKLTPSASASSRSQTTAGTAGAGAGAARR